MRDQRGLDAAGDRRQRPEVVDDADPADRPRDGRRVGQAALDDLDGRAEVGEVRPQAGAEVVEHADRPAAADQVLDQVRADEPGPAGDQTQFVHELPPRRPSAGRGSLSGPRRRAVYAGRVTSSAAARASSAAPPNRVLPPSSITSLDRVPGRAAGRPPATAVSNARGSSCGLERPADRDLEPLLRHRLPDAGVVRQQPVQDPRRDRHVEDQRQAAVQPDRPGRPDVDLADASATGSRGGPGRSPAGPARPARWPASASSASPRTGWRVSVTTGPGETDAAWSVSLPRTVARSGSASGIGCRPGRTSTSPSAWSTLAMAGRAYPRASAHAAGVSRAALDHPAPGERQVVPGRGEVGRSAPAGPCRRRTWPRPG